MAIVVITEGRSIGGQTSPSAQAMGSTISESAYTVTAGSVTSSFSFSAQTTIIRICSMSGPIAYAYGPAPVATTTSTPLPSASVEYRCVSPGDKFAAITLS